MGSPYDFDFTKPDGDFVLRGRSPTRGFRDPDFKKNSQNTSTTYNLTQNSEYEPTNYTEELIPSRVVSAGSRSFGGKPKSSGDSSWYTRPIHLSQDYEQFPLFESMGVPVRGIAGVRRPVGMTGASIAAQKPKEYKLRSSKEMKDFVLSHLNKSEAYHFPVTMSSTKLVGDGPPLVKPTAILSQHGISQKLAPKRSKSPRRSRSRTRSKSTERHLDTSKTLEKMYLLSSEAPTIGSSSVYVTSPYQQELSHLRMEQLRLEEDQLLELKRQVELERIRGPKPKWYELKTPEFHYESHKNTEMLKSQESWNDFLRYRSDLTQASKDFQMSLGEVI